jgi:phage tail-like protein
LTTPTVPGARALSATNGAIPPANGRGPALGAPWADAPLGVPKTRSSYLDHLPGIYQEDDFLGRFLLIFEHIFSPVEQTSGSTWTYFDAGLTPEDFLPWLGSWIGMLVDARMPAENKREVIRAAPELYRWRGTKRGLRAFLKLFTGIEPEITEPTLAEIAANRNLAYRFTVRMVVPRGQELSRAYVETLVEAEKPAFAACAIEIVSE